MASIIKEIKKNYYLARVDTVVGHKDDAGVDILTIAYKHEIYPDFSKKTMSEIEDIPTEVDPKELTGIHNRWSRYKRHRRCDKSQ